VENVAETGATFTLENELETSREEGKVAEFVIGKNQFNGRDPAQTLGDIHLNAAFPFLSAITMVAPSPDWFTGIPKFSPISDEGFWYKSFTIATGPYDAGTEKGDTYSIGNSAEEEHLPISRFTVETVPDSGILLDPSGTTVLPMVEWSCVLQPSTTINDNTKALKPEAEVVPTKMVPSTSMTDLNDAAYSCVLTNTWSAATHPIGYADVSSSAHWSPPILVAHKADYDLWAPGSLASPGVENVAETGATFTLENELETSREEGKVAEFVIGKNQFNGRDPAQTLGDIHLNAAFPFLSAITMVAPSPDWFTGIPKFSPISDEGFWYKSFTIATGPYDAGTEKGDTYSIGNSAEEEHLPISRFTVETVPDSGILLDPSGTTVLPMVEWSCVLQPSTTAKPGRDTPDPNYEKQIETSEKCSGYFDTCTEDAQCCSAVCYRGRCGGRSRVDGRGEGVRLSNQDAVLGGAAGRFQRSGNNRRLGVAAPTLVWDQQQKEGRRLRGFNH